MENTDPTIPTTENLTDPQQDEDDQPSNQQAAELNDQQKPQDEADQQAKADSEKADAYFKERIANSEKTDASPGNFHKGLQRTENRLAHQGKQMTHQGDQLTHQGQEIAEVKKSLGEIKQLLQQGHGASDPTVDEGDPDDYMTRGEAQKLLKAQQAQRQVQSQPPTQTPRVQAQEQVQTEVSYEQATSKMAENVRGMFPEVKNIGGKDRAADIVALSLPGIQAFMARNPGLPAQAVEEYAESVVENQIQRLAVDGLVSQKDNGEKPKGRPTNETGTRNLVPPGVSSPSAMKPINEAPPMNAAEAEKRILNDPKLQKLARQRTD